MVEAAHSEAAHQLRLAQLAAAEARQAEEAEAAAAAAATWGVARAMAKAVAKRAALRRLLGVPHRLHRQATGRRGAMARSLLRLSKLRHQPPRNRQCRLLCLRSAMSNLASAPALALALALAPVLPLPDPAARAPEAAVVGVGLAGAGLAVGAEVLALKLGRHRLVRVLR